MAPRTSIKRRTIIISILSLLTLAMLAPSSSTAQEMTICPAKIILNARGQFDNIQAVLRMPMTPGYALADYHVTLSFNGTVVSEAYAMRYCYIDDNFLVSFERTPIQANPVVIGMANSTVGATVEGWFEAVNGDGDSYRQSFSYTAMVEILDPDKK